MAKQLCTVCGEVASGFNKYPHPVGNTILCDKCYDKLPSLSLVVNFQTADQLKKNQEMVMEELQNNSFPKEAIKDIENWFENKRKILKYENTHTDTQKKLEEFNKEYQQGKFQDEINNFITTSGYNFEGFKITEYHGVVVGETVIGTGFLSEITASFADTLGVEATRYSQKLETARNSSMNRAIAKAIFLGGNALIGVDIDYVTFSTDKIGVIYTGTSVKIEKLEV